MTGFAQILAGSRRLYILRLLEQAGGGINESSLITALRAGGFPAASARTVAGDLDHLLARGCVRDDWFEDRLRVLTITPRGSDVAFGREAVEGVEAQRWDRE